MYQSAWVGFFVPVSNLLTARLNLDEEAAEWRLVSIRPRFITKSPTKRDETHRSIFNSCSNHLTTGQNLFCNPPVRLNKRRLYASQSPPRRMHKVWDRPKGKSLSPSLCANSSAWSRVLSIILPWAKTMSLCRSKLHAGAPSMRDFGPMMCIARRGGDLAEKVSDRLTIEWLPAYAPELNPTEQVWNHTKYGD